MAKRSPWWDFIGLFLRYEEIRLWLSLFVLFPMVNLYVLSRIALLVVATRSLLDFLTDGDAFADLA